MTLMYTSYDCCEGEVKLQSEPTIQWELGDVIQEIIIEVFKC